MHSCYVQSLNALRNTWINRGEVGRNSQEKDQNLKVLMQIKKDKLIVISK